MINFYITVPPTAVQGPGSVYAQHTNHFSNIRILKSPRKEFLLYLAEEIKPGKKRR